MGRALEFLVFMGVVRDPGLLFFMAPAPVSVRFHNISIVVVGLKLNGK